MKKVLLICAAIAILAGLTGCSSFLRPKGKVEAGRVLPFYSGSKARIAIADFNIETAKAAPEIAWALREMLVKALLSSNRFSIAERQELNAGELNGGVQGKAKPPDLIINVSVAEFEPQASGGRSGVGGGGGQASGAMGGLLGAALNKSHIILDIRITDSSSSKILARERIRGQATDATAGFMSGVFGSSASESGLSAYADSPMEKAMRICIIEGARFVAQSVPANYYNH